MQVFYTKRFQSEHIRKMHLLYLLLSGFLIRLYCLIVIHT